jgi:hypothetical protein
MMFVSTLAVIIAVLNAVATAGAKGLLEPRASTFRLSSPVQLSWKEVVGKSEQSHPTEGPNRSNGGSDSLASSELCYTYTALDPSAASALSLSCYTALRGGASEIIAESDGVETTEQDRVAGGADTSEEDLDAEEDTSANASSGFSDSSSGLPSGSGSASEIDSPTSSSHESASYTKAGADVLASSPMDSLKRIWRDLIRAPPSSAELELIMQGKRAGYKVQHSDVAPTADHHASDTTNSTGAAAISTSDMAVNVLRANGTDHESLYRQVLSQFLSPLSSDGRRALWLDQEFALNLKGSVVLAHQPELWQGIGEGLKPKLTRGVRLVTPASEVNSQGKTKCRKWIQSICLLEGGISLF